MIGRSESEADRSHETHRLVEALLAGATTDGERAAAACGIAGFEGAQRVSGQPGVGPSPIDLVDDIPRTQRALRVAIREALIRDKRDCHSVPIWRNERVEWIPPEEIPGDPLPADGE